MPVRATGLRNAATLASAEQRRTLRLLHRAESLQTLGGVDYRSWGTGAKSMDMLSDLPVPKLALSELSDLTDMVLLAAGVHIRKC